MMPPVVIDTNVLLVANNSHQEVSEKCRQTCIERLLACQRHGTVVIDDRRRILAEYLKKTWPNSPKGPGDAFLKWLMQNAANEKRVHQVSITEATPFRFAEFPDKALQNDFDRDDRKFVAVSCAHSARPSILQATDSKWANWNARLKASSVVVDFLCKEDIARFHQATFPGAPIPDLS